MDSQPQKASTVTQPGKGAKPKRRRRGLFNFVLLIGIIAAVGLFGWAEMQRRDATRRLQETEQELQKIRESTERRGTEVAQEVLGKVRQLMDVPTEPEPTVATIIDVEALRQSNEFYNKAENGDHLIITETRAILFDPDRGIILDVVPISITPEDQQQIPEGQDAQQPPAGAPPANQPPAEAPPAGGGLPPAAPATSPAPAGGVPPA